MNHNSDPTSGRTDTPDTPEVAVVDPKALVERYMALWNEPDPDARRAIIRQLWAPAGEHVLDPPQELRQGARALGFAAPRLELRGYAARLRNLVKFNWELVSRATGEVAAVGLDVLTLDDQGRITVDYVFVEG